MMTPREKIRVTLMFSGIVLFLCGVVVGCAEKNEVTDDYTFRVGAWKDGGVAAGVPKDVVPWLLVSGILVFAGSFISRDR